MTRTIHVRHKFTIQHDSGNLQTFSAGEHIISDEVAEHPYLRTHERVGSFKFVDPVVLAEGNETVDETVDETVEDDTPDPAIQVVADKIAAQTAKLSALVGKPSEDAAVTKTKRKTP